MANPRRKPSDLQRDTIEAADHLDRRLDEALDETFPASDPAAVSPAPSAAPAADGERVRDNAAEHRFEMVVDGRLAVAEYVLAPGTITFVHTEVPPQLESRGIGSLLIAGALEQVRARGLKVESRCSFVSRFLRTHDEFRDPLR